MGVKKDGDYGTMHRILKILTWRYATPSELAELLGVSRQAVHYHLQRLIEWGFVVRSTKECIMAECIDENRELCTYDENGETKFIQGGECKQRLNDDGDYYVYAVNYYVRKLFPGRPSQSFKNPPTTFINMVRTRLEKLGEASKVRGYDLILMAGILQMMAAVLWNPAPRGDSYWVRLQHLTAKGIHRKITDYIMWYISAKAVREARRRYPESGEKRREEYDRLLREYREKYAPSLKKVRWILAKMYDYMMVERLGGDHCPYGAWVPHPSLFTPDGKPDFHLPRHRHVDAKHRYRSLNVKQSFTDSEQSNNQETSQNQDN